MAEPFLEYCRLRLVEDPHLWASTLYDELAKLGFTGSYPSLTAAIRTHRLRPHCEPCQASKGRDSTVITHPPGEEIQWDWFERRRAPWGGTANVLLGTRYTDLCYGYNAFWADQIATLDLPDHEAPGPEAGMLGAALVARELAP